MEQIIKRRLCSVKKRLNFTDSLPHLFLTDGSFLIYTFHTTDANIQVA